MKDKKGVTLIALVITIIVILILASIAIYSGASTIRYAKYNKAKSEIQVIQSYVNQWYQEYQDPNKRDDISSYGKAIAVAITDGECTQAEIDNTFANGGITDENKKGNYRFFSASFLKDKIGIDASFDYLISIPDRNTILYNGVMYNKKPYYTLDDFDVQNIKETANSDIEFALEQGDNTNIVIKDLKIIYTEFKRKEENGETTVVPVKRMNDLSNFIVEYQKVGETNWTDATKDVTNFNDNGNTKFKFSVSEGNYNIRIFSTDKKIQSKEKEIAVIKSKLTPNELAAIATHNQNHPDDIIEELPQNEIPNNLKDPDKIKAVLTGKVPIPDKAEYLEGSKDTGVVIRYKGSEFVWVPVPDAIYDSTNDDKLPKSAETGSLTEGHNYTPMAINIGTETNEKGFKKVRIVMAKVS